MRPAAATDLTIDLRRCSPTSDFGRGFYTTTHERQARSWANGCADDAGGSAAIIGFDVDREALALLAHLAFVRPNSDFYGLVAFSRANGLAHGRVGGIPYDTVYGPVCIWPQRFIIDGCDQISFHTARALRALTVASVVVAMHGMF